MPPRAQVHSKFLRVTEILYLFLIALCFYWLIVSRTGEARTVWDVLHPLFIPTLFVATSFLLALLMTSEKTTFKLLLIIVYSVLFHSLFSVIFPAGDLSGQQSVLGRTRLVYDNVIIHGWPQWTPAIPLQQRLFAMFNGINFQAALSTIFARMLGLDILWVHLFLVPVLWGVFTPIATYLATLRFCGNENAAVLAGLLLPAFPYATYFGAISVPTSLGYIFLFFASYFMLEYLSSESSKATRWMLIFSFFAIISHYLTGVLSFSLVFLSFAFKTFRGERQTSAIARKASLIISFVFSASLLPLALIYLRFFQSGTYTAFTLEKLGGLSFTEIIGLFALGELADTSGLLVTVLMIIGPALALFCMVYLYFARGNSNSKFRDTFLFLSAAFLLVLVDYRILKIFMSGLPLNEERLWVFRDFASSIFVAYAISSIFSRVTVFLKTRPYSAFKIRGLKKLPKGNFQPSLLLVASIVFSLVLAGWVTTSLSVAYPRNVPFLQTTWYELDAAKYIDGHTTENYVVIGDLWTVYAGEMIVGVYNPRAYYFSEADITRERLFAKMLNDTSTQIMLEAMNQTGTDTRIAYFIVTEPRLGTEEFDRIVLNAEEKLGPAFYITGDGKLYVYQYQKE